MTRLDDIRVRLNAATKPYSKPRDEKEFHAKAPEDIAFLLALVEKYEAALERIRDIPHDIAGDLHDTECARCIAVNVLEAS